MNVLIALLNAFFAQSFLLSLLRSQGRSHPNLIADALEPTLKSSSTAIIASFGSKIKKKSPFWSSKKNLELFAFISISLSFYCVQELFNGINTIYSRTLFDHAVVEGRKRAAMSKD